MKNIIIIKALIESLSPLNISDGEDLLIDNEGKAYMPATTIAGSFRAYLDSIDENQGDLFGMKGEASSQSRIYIKDSFAENKGYEIRPRVRIDNELGTSQDMGKFEDMFLTKGLRFNLEFKIETNKENIEKDKIQIYKALKALDDSFIRIGGNKSNGLGIFKLIDAEEINYNLKDRGQWLKYLRKDKSNSSDIKEKILKIENPEDYVEFKLKGTFSTPLLIGGIESFDSDEVDNSSVMSVGQYIIPGSSFKGLLRARINKISDLFNQNQMCKEIFGEKTSNKNGEKDSFLSRVFVNESIILEEKESIYNRIKIDKFTGGVRKSGLMDDRPVEGSTEFKVIYRKQKDKDKDNYAIGIILLALRDLGNEDLSLGGGFSIGRGRFRASHMSIVEGKEKITIDFEDKTVSNKEKLDIYVESVNSFVEEAKHGK